MTSTVACSQVIGVDQRARADRPTFPASARPRPSTASVSTPRPALLLQSLGRSFRRDMQGTYQHGGRAKRAHTSASPSLIVTEIARPFRQGSALPGHEGRLRASPAQVSIFTSHCWSGAAWSKTSSTVGSSSGEQTTSGSTGSVGCA